MREILEKVREGVVDAVLPAKCVGEHGFVRPEGRYVCQEHKIFFVEAALICPACQQAIYTGERHLACAPRYGLDGLVSAWEYEGVVKKLLNAVKYGFLTHAVQETAREAFGVMARDEKRFYPFLSFLSSENGNARATVITYVPMRKSQEKQRGFNQAALFAKELGKTAQCEVMPLLEKIKDTPSQTELGKEERLANVRGAFRAKFKARNPKPETSTNDKNPNDKTLFEFQDSNFAIPPKVVLVDDVWTTGATMRECCKVLKKAGVQEVWGFAIARTV